MKTEQAKPTIRFSTRLKAALLTLPKGARADLPRGMVMIEATINGFPFRAALEPDDNDRHCLRVNKVMLDAAGADACDMVTVEITRVGNEPATRVPVDLTKALAAAPRSQAWWAEITPNARQNWILWICTGKLPKTREDRIKKACAMLAAGKKRVCCFGGLNWLRKDHRTAGETWLPL